MSDADDGAAAPPTGELSLKATSWEIVGRVAVIRLDRPHRNNAWTGRMHHEYRALIDRAETDPDIRCIVVTGEGRSFCVGADSDALAGHVDRGGYDPGLPAELPTPGYGVRPDYDDDFVFHYGLRTPVIAAINGPCAGVGFVLACYADLRFAAKGARMATANARLGLPAEFGLSWVLPRLVGVTRAAELLMTGRKFRAEEAEHWGLFNEVIEIDDLMPHVMEVARGLAEDVGPDAVATIKYQLYRDADRSVGPAVADAQRFMREAMAGPEFAEGVRAFRDGVPPDFPNAAVEAAAPGSNMGDTPG
ncbi:enoyl-CoA hydratase-related protein [Candidatus Neomicrothrix sp.]|jgi:enoyl-CoA hydratase/carnithine racemase|uniref:Enoyl-CoA hydratase/isomerase family protein n=1 Tax=Candidatus Neomicrothrix subdominans TaxID=2954438 RepID=A0A936NBA6_9ACTN|nr:enoyl-CoA hydratase-related protein [Candidatus Microthrix sp.]MBK9296499.1 enoyl-CoA hydratase/isomerase family protein [Candidatus Microthrix subdominans]MBK6311592.1 enoyl-CoA hydratase/isomerase family protein [Candidatus Microthrix sp.]MBK6438028.1 enoyl-CoA hydratase/isomerase family protein [Candidatus Microthrix sp.]MBK6971076.1 enoyl-CoA hydratase/isomerase family protein [Candidatus Microthrix sp.]MBK7164428.1 enoyl-CoA hydratase/isomerase family protein [Candidatus Microthrix sp.